MKLRFCLFISSIYTIFCLMVLFVGCGEEKDKITNVPTQPTGLAHSLSKGKVSLHWESAKYASTYRIYRGDKIDGSFEVIGTNNESSYDDTKVEPGKTYYYKVAGISSDGVEGKPSAPYQVNYEVGKLLVTQETIDFGESSVSYDLKLRNDGGLELHWTLETKDKWIISLDPKEGDLNPQEEKFARIIIERKGEPGDYKGAVIVKADTGQGEITVPIKMKIAAEPHISIDPKEISFEGYGQTHTLTIQNIGTGILEWNIQNVPDWLILDNLKGQTSNVSSSRIQLSIKDGGILQPDKTYPATLNIESNDPDNPKLTLNIKLHTMANPPKLNISDSDKYVVFKSSESSKSVSVHNSGGGVMKWRVQIESGVSWLKVDPQQGETNPDRPDPLTFTVDREGAIPGKTLKTTIIIDAGDAGKQSVVIEAPIPEDSWVVSPESIMFDDSGMKTITIRNTGEEHLQWTGSSKDNWIILKDKNGEVDPGKEYYLQVSIESSSLTVGSHLGNVELTTKGGKQISVRIQTIKKAYITGRVLNSRSRATVNDVQVSLDDKPAKTYQSGSFQLERNMSGPFALKAEKRGYIPAIFNGILNDLGTTAPVEMWLRPIPHSTRTILDPSKPFNVPVDMCFSSDGTRVYVSDESGTISIIDAVKDTVIDQVQVGKSLRGVIAHPRNSEVYIADSGEHQVIVFDTRTRKVATSIKVDKSPEQMAISGDGKWLYVTCRNSASVVLIDTELHQVKSSYRNGVGREPCGIVLSPDEQTIYIADYGDNDISVLNALNGQSINKIPVSNKPQYLTVSKERLYVSNSTGDRVSVIDQRSQRVVEHIEMGELILLGDLAVIEEAYGGNVIYVVDQANNSLRIIDDVTLRVIDEGIPLGDSPTTIAIQSDLSKIYVINSNSADISILEF